MIAAAHGAADILVRVDRNALARWVVWLCQTLERRPQARIAVELVERVEDDRALRSLLVLERLVLRRGRDCGSDRVQPDALGARLTEPADFRAGLVVDLTAGLPAPQPNAAVLRPLYDGHAGQSALAGTLFAHGTPEIAIECREPGAPEPHIVASGFASLEAAAGIGGGMEAVFSRVVTLICKALDAGTDEADFSCEVVRGRALRTIGRGDVAGHTARSVARQAVRAAYELCCYPSHWRVGWRFSPPGQDVWSRRDLGGARWNVLPDPIDHFYADPFPIHWRGGHHLFFEDLDHKTGKGIISAISFDGEGRPGPVTPVLEEPWHLSYPFLIEWAGDLWMIPESSANRDIAIYRALDFPLRWERYAVLIADIEAADATIVEHDNLFWLFAVTRDGVGGYSDTLRVWHAHDLLGPWTPLADNPVLVDDRSARPAGNMVWRSDGLFRPVQDCRAAYGAAVNLMRVTRLDRDGFAQEHELTLQPGHAWPGRRIHTLNESAGLEAIDGFVLRPKWQFLADRVDARFRPR